MEVYLILSLEEGRGVAHGEVRHHQALRNPCEAGVTGIGGECEARSWLDSRARSMYNCGAVTLREPSDVGDLRTSYRMNAIWS